MAHLPKANALLLSALVVAASLLVVLPELRSTEHFFASSSSSVRRAPSTASSSQSSRQNSVFAVGALSGSGSHQANGLVQLEGVAGADPKIFIQLNIEQADSEHRFDAWVRSRNGDNLQKLGTLRPRFNDVRHFGEFSSKGDFSESTECIITLQKRSDSDDRFGIVVASGMINPTARSSAAGVQNP